MTAKDDRKNAEGYNDPTAYNAIKNVEQEQDKDDMRFHQLLNVFTLRIGGFPYRGTSCIEG